MLNLLRRVNFPKGLQMQGHVIRGKTIGYVANYDDIIAYANKAAAEILDAAKAEAQAIKDHARAEIAASLRQDIDNIKAIGTKRMDQLSEQSSQICIEICCTAMEHMLEQAPDIFKLEKLIRALLERSLGGHTLHIECNPEQSAMVEQALAGILAEQLMIRKWEVTGSPDIKPFELKIKAAQGSEIQVSLDNILSLFKKEVTMLQHDIAQTLVKKGEHYEKVD